MIIDRCAVGRIVPLRRFDHQVARRGRRPGLALARRPTAGQRHDALRALPLLDGLAPTYLMANCGYDSAPLMALLAARGTQTVIPPPRKRRHSQAYDPVRYGQRQPVERLFSRLKPFRRAVTRYDKLDAHFLAFIHLAATVL